ncbi:MAG: hypothetical protein NZ853_10695 [Leptospiraceae bacterium]|nr:hypothetical protein [Leptospiraceae bacterium]MDW7977079.1 hypothetical protein [Leptospiraceae bacterium]
MSIELLFGLAFAFFLIVGFVILYFSLSSEAPSKKKPTSYKKEKIKVNLTSEEKQEMINNTKEVVKENPKQASMIIRKWLNDEKK